MHGYVCLCVTLSNIASTVFILYDILHYILYYIIVFILYDTIYYINQNFTF